MFNPPMTLNQAVKHLYGRDSNIIYALGRCAWEVADPPHYIYFHQCSFKNGHGPDNLYCKIHAKKFISQDKH